jgi:hypothetical protein
MLIPYINIFLVSASGQLLQVAGKMNIKLKLSASSAKGY